MNRFVKIWGKTNGIVVIIYQLPIRIEERVTECYVVSDFYILGRNSKEEISNSINKWRLERWDLGFHQENSKEEIPNSI
jgi:hypothetical protein